MHALLELELIDGPPLARRRWRVADGFTIGRAETSRVALPEPSVSRRHALIEADADGWTLKDCHSRIGTRLNELPLEAGARAALHAGDVIGVGPWRFRVGSAAADAGEAETLDEAARVDVVGRLGSLAEQRLELVLRCADEVAAARDEQTLADVLAEYALLGSGYARAAVLWRRGDELELRSARPDGSARGAFRFSRSLIASAAAGGIARIDADADAAATPRPRRALCAPLALDARNEAYLYLEADRSARRGHADAPTYCHALARLAALALANLRRLDSERERARLAADLERAREVQRRLLPDERETAGGLRFAIRLEPGRSVAGDIADVVALAGGGAAVLLGDVSGAGLGAGLIMASVRSFLRAELAHDADPARALGRLNRHLCTPSSQGGFVTLWLGVFEPGARRCRFVDAGHGHALRVGADGAAPIRPDGGIPLGIDADAAFTAETLGLDRGELVLLYSDGVVEQRAPDGAPFGRERLLAAASRARTPHECVAAVLDALGAHARDAAPDDDRTLLAVAWDA